MIWTCSMSNYKSFSFLQILGRKVWSRTFFLPLSLRRLQTFKDHLWTWIKSFKQSLTHFHASAIHCYVKKNKKKKKTRNKSYFRVWTLSLCEYLLGWYHNKQTVLAANFWLLILSFDLCFDMIVFIQTIKFYIPSDHKSLVTRYITLFGTFHQRKCYDVLKALSTE